MPRWLRRLLCRWLGAPVCRTCAEVNGGRCIRRCDLTEQQRTDYYVLTGRAPGG